MSRGHGGNEGRGGHWIRSSKRAAIYARDQRRCLWCDAPVGADATLDHFLPRRRGGSNCHTNLITACVSCNAARCDRPALIFGSHAALERIFAALTKPMPYKIFPVR